MVRSHVLICGGTGCTSSNSAAIMEKMKAELEAVGLQDEVNVVTIRVKKCEDGCVNEWDNPVTRAYPKLPEGLKQLIEKKSADKLELMKKYYPKRMHGLLECFSQADIKKVLVLDEALASGELTPLSERQRKGVMQLVFVGV